MEYQPMIPPFETNPFKEMDKKEAQQYFDWYVNEIPNRLEILKNYYEYTGGQKDDLDFSPESLVALWKWFISQVKFEKKTKEEIQLALQKYPSWLKREVLKGKRKLSSVSQAIADDISIYFAEVVIKNMNNIKWGFMTKPKSFISVNRPILQWFRNKTPMDPRGLIDVKCSKLMDGDKNPNALYNMFNVWKESEIE